MVVVVLAALGGGYSLGDTGGGLGWSWKRVGRRNFASEYCEDPDTFRELSVSWKLLWGALELHK